MRALWRAHWVLLATWLVFLFIGLATANPFQSATRRLYSPAEAGSAAQVPQSLAQGRSTAIGERGGVPVGLTPRPGWVALSFDDGPDPRWTPEVLEVLERHGVHGTFFTVGSQVVQHPATLRRVADAGHEVGLHTFSHVNLSSASPSRTRAELAANRMVVEAVTGRTTSLVRPPFSATPDELDDDAWHAARAVAGQGYVVALSTLDSEDWRPSGPESLDAQLARARADGMAGQVVLFHDGGGDRSRTVAGLDALLTRLQADGWKVGTVGQALGLADVRTPVPMTDRLVDGLAGAGLFLATWSVRILTLVVLVAGVVAVVRAVLLLAAALRHHRRPATVGGPDGPVTVVVPAYNEEAGIEATIASLAASTHPVRVIVVDDGSTDRTAEIARAAAAVSAVPVEVITQANAGKAAALNTGLAACTTDLVVMVDGDTVFEPDTVTALIAPFADQRVGAVSGNAKVANRQGLLGRWQHIEYVLGFNMDRRMYDQFDCMPTVPGAVGAFRTRALRAAGGLSTDTLAEDTDLTLQLGRAGWRVRYAPGAVAWTEAPQSLSSLWRQRYRWSYGTMQAMWKNRAGLRSSSPTERRYLTRSLAYMTLFQVLFPLLAPAVDLFTVYGLFALDVRHMFLVWAFFLAIDVVLAVVAFRMDGERMGPLWALPLTQFVYRQLMYLVVIHSLFTALSGKALAWQRMERYGTHQDSTAQPPSPAAAAATA